MHESQTLAWRDVIEKYHSTLVDELGSSLDSAFDAERTRSAAEIERVRRDAASQIERLQTEIVENYNQSVRRLQQAPSPSAIFELLAELAHAHAARVVVVSVQSGQTVARRGIDEGDLTIAVRDAAAISSAIASKDAVVAAASGAEISEPLAKAFSDAGGKVYLFPLVVRQEVMSVLLASGNVTPAALELLGGVAALRLETFPAPVEKPAVQRSGWEALSEEDQKLHLQAQRVARVKVAELRLYHADELRKGVSEHDIYGALRDQIESIRTSFLQMFLSKSPTMVDYLHLELVRSLAHDDDRLLGENYPGPMV